MASTSKETTARGTSIDPATRVADPLAAKLTGSKTGRILLSSVAQALLIAVLLFFFLGGWNRNWSAPLSFSSDSLVFLMQSKTTMDIGWWWTNPWLSAPSTFDALAFPSDTNVDQLIVWTVSWFTANALLCVNLAWLAMVILSGLTASWCIRRLGGSAVGSWMAGTLFAVSPYAIYRNIDHFCLVVYLVPFACAAALLLASGRVPERLTWKGSGGFVIGCALLGFDYVYYAFFACFFLGVATLAGFFNFREKRILRAGSVCLLVVIVSTALNLLPSAYSWHVHGKPILVREKVPAESEVYGLKIRQLVSPVFQHSFPPFRRWTEKEGEARYPVETENMISRLGLVSTIGFLGLLALLFLPGSALKLDPGRTLVSASQLTIAALLLSTVGGFGSLFALLVSPEIRAYNRICPFIAFFSLTAIVLAMDAAFGKSGWRLAIAAGIVLMVGILDQSQAAIGLNANRDIVADEAHQLSRFVGQIERSLPARSMVFQLPFTTYLNDSGMERMKPYDHLKPYLVSRTIHWSYPALSNDQVQWQQAAARLSPLQLAYQLAADGFAAIWVDRYGYPDNGASVVAAISSALKSGGVLAENARYTVLDIRPLKGAGSAAAIGNLAAPPTPATAIMAPCPGEPVLNIEEIGTATGPFLGRAIPVSVSGEFKVSGWAVDQPHRSAASDLDVVIDHTPFPTIYGGERPDVANYFKIPAYRASGFVAMIPAGKSGMGRHTLSLRVVSSDHKCYYQSPGLVIVFK